MRLVCVLIFLFVSNYSSAQSRQSQTTAVIVQTLVFESLTSSIEAVGSAQALQSVDVFPAVADKVTGVYFRPGQTISKGEVLLELDARKQKIALQRAQIELADASRNLQRLMKSKDNGAVTQSALDEAKTIEDLAKVTLLNAKTELDDRKVIAPFTGVLGLSDVEVGDRITLNTLITTIDNRSKLFVNFNAPESSLHALMSEKSEVTVQPWSNRDVTLAASIEQIDSRINEQDRTIRVRALLDNVNTNYLPGMSFRVRLSVAGQTLPAIPESALSWGPNDAYVWTVVNNKAQKVSVQIQQRLRGRILVRGDLHANDVLIVEGIQRLRQGQTVNVVDQRAVL